MDGRNIKRILHDYDLDLVRRLLKFANLERIESQRQVYEIFFDSPLVVSPFKVIPEEEGVGPFERDQAAIKRVLTALTRKDKREIGDALRQTSAAVHRAVKFGARVEITQTTARRADPTVELRPLLDGIEACIWLPLAFIFINGVGGLIRACRLDSCGKFFLYTPKLRSYCSMEHAEEGKPLAVRRAIDAWQADTPEKVLKLLSRAAAKDERSLSKRETMWIEIFGRDRFGEMRDRLIAFDAEAPVREIVAALPPSVRERLQQAMEAAQRRSKGKPKTVTKRGSRSRRGKNVRNQKGREKR